MATTNLWALDFQQDLRSMTSGSEAYATSDRSFVPSLQVYISHRAILAAIIIHQHGDWNTLLQTCQRARLTSLTTYWVSNCGTIKRLETTFNRSSSHCRQRSATPIHELFVAKRLCALWILSNHSFRMLRSLVHGSVPWDMPGRPTDSVTVPNIHSIGESDQLSVCTLSRLFRKYLVGLRTKLIPLLYSTTHVPRIAT